jgi:HlyD family secretion protein
MRRFVLLVAAYGVAVCGCSRDRAPQDLVAAGHVEGTEVRISSEIGGKLVSFPLLEGDKVAKGQEVARIDPQDVQLALAAARAQREEAAAELALKRAGARKEEIAEAEANVEAARGEQEAAVKDLERLERLLDDGVVTAKARDDAQARRDVAAGRLEAAKARLAALRAGSRREEIEAARSRVAAADARVAQLEENAGDTVVTSAVAGVLTEKVAEEGEQVASGETLAVVTDLAHAWLNVYVGELDLGRLRLGQTVSVVTDDGKSRPGRITFIASEAEFTPKNVQTRDERVKLVYRVKVGLDNGDGFYKPGMPAEARSRE